MEPFIAGCSKLPPRDITDLLPQLEERAALVARAATNALRVRGESEARELRVTLERQRRRVGAELAKYDAAKDQLTLGLNHEEEHQRRADVAAWRRRLSQFDRDLESEPSPDSPILRSAGAAR